MYVRGQKINKLTGLVFFKTNKNNSVIMTNSFKTAGCSTENFN